MITKSGESDARPSGGGGGVDRVIESGPGVEIEGPGFAGGELQAEAGEIDGFTRPKPCGAFAESTDARARVGREVEGEYAAWKEKKDEVARSDAAIREFEIDSVEPAYQGGGREAMASDRFPETGSTSAPEGNRAFDPSHGRFGTIGGAPG